MLSYVLLVYIYRIFHRQNLEIHLKFSGIRCARLLPRYRVEWYRFGPRTKWKTGLRLHLTLKVLIGCLTWFTTDTITYLVVVLA